MADRPNKLRGLLLPALFGVWSLALAGASCDKKPANAAVDARKASPDAATPSAKPTAGEPLPGVPVADLAPEQRKMFDGLVDKLQSACGKPHSLRTSLKTDPDCKRSIFAGRYVARLVKSDAPADEIEARYHLRYAPPKTYSFD